MNGDFKNPWGSTEDDYKRFVEEVCIISCKDTGRIISGRAY